MSVIRLTKEFSFEMAHALDGYDGACSQIHGHSYRLYVTVKGEPVADQDDPKLGMVMDFGVLKNIVNNNIVKKYDHSLLINVSGTNKEVVNVLKKHFDRIILTEYQPTCENLISDFAHILIQELPETICLHSLRLHETATSFAEWYAEDNPSGK